MFDLVTFFDLYSILTFFDLFENYFCSFINKKFQRKTACLAFCTAAALVNQRLL